jgi:DNA polymerase III subunit epsilon
VRAVQQSLDQLGTPLVEVEFAVLDLETTGGSPATDRITEVGVVKVRGGEVTGTFHALVNPLMPIPPMITALTGISDAMVANQEPIEVVLPCLLEFLGDAVLVAHNASFDTRFLQAALLAHAYPRLESSVVCTARLARVLLPRDEVPNVKLATLARYLRAETQPCHRAFTDAKATVDVLHALLERAAGFGVLSFAAGTTKCSMSARQAKTCAAVCGRTSLGTDVPRWKSYSTRWRQSTTSCASTTWKQAFAKYA